jgi:hypothetical protein
MTPSSRWDLERTAQPYASRDGRYWARTSDPQLVELEAHRSTMPHHGIVGHDLGHAYGRRAAARRTCAIDPPSLERVSRSQVPPHGLLSYGALHGTAPSPRAGARVRSEDASIPGVVDPAPRPVVLCAPISRPVRTGVGRPACTGVRRRRRESAPRSIGRDAKRGKLENACHCVTTKTSR